MEHRGGVQEINMIAKPGLGKVVIGMLNKNRWDNITDGFTCLNALSKCCCH